MEGVKQAHERLLRDPSFQFRFPDAPPDPLPPVHGSFAIGPGAFWVVVAVVAVVLLVVLVQALRNRGLPSVAIAPAADEGGAEAPLPQVAPASVVVLADADALAGAGRYGDAVHALLLRGVGAIQAQFPRALLPAHTSRDIAALPVLTAASRQAFGGIAAHVERAVFAERPLGRDDWERCRSLYTGLLGSQAVVSVRATAASA